MTEFTGKLVGGPNDGDILTSARREIPTEQINRLWLNGPEGSSFEVMEEGLYKWDGFRFNWNLVDARVLNGEKV